MIRFFAPLLLSFALTAPTFGQAPPSPVYPEPDKRGEVVIAEPAYQGHAASAPIPPGMHIRNEGGSDGSGLCVYASMVMDGAFQKIADLDLLKGSALWRYAKSRPGGSYPEKLVKDVDSVYGERATVVSYYGKDATVLDDWSRRGYPIGATMGTGRNYQYKSIAHMISLLHYRTDGWACVLDNNFPGVYSWMPASEFDRRWKQPGGDGWAARWEGPEPADGDRDEFPGIPDPLVFLIVVVAGGIAAILLGPKRDSEATRAWLAA